MVVPFNSWSKERLDMGSKVATSRNKRYGDMGDYFEVDFGNRSRIYKITHVVEVPLSVVKQFFWREEGCNSSKEFVEVWEDIHPRKGFVPDQEVWLHLFEEWVVGQGDSALFDKQMAFLVFDSLEWMLTSSARKGDFELAARYLDTLFSVASQLEELFSEYRWECSEGARMDLNVYMEESAITSAIKEVMEWSQETGHPVSDWFSDIEVEGWED